MKISIAANLDHDDRLSSLRGRVSGLGLGGLHDPGIAAAVAIDPD